MMRDEAEHFPPYDFESNVGYPAPVHKAALAGYGPSAIHRRSWIFMEQSVLAGPAPAAGAAVRLISGSRDGCRPARGARRALDATGRLVAGVGDDQWDVESVCDDWTVRELVNHIVTGNWWAAELDWAARPSTRSATASTATSSATIPLRAYDESAVAAAAPVPRTGRDGRAGAVSYGPVPGSVYCGHRFMDVLVHGWDVAASTGQDTALDADLVDACWAVVEPQLEQLVGQRRVRHRRSRCPRTTSPQTRLLAALGRHGADST